MQDLAGHPLRRLPRREGNFKDCPPTHSAACPPKPQSAHCDSISPYFRRGHNTIARLHTRLVVGDVGRCQFSELMQRTRPHLCTSCCATRPRSHLLNSILPFRMRQRDVGECTIQVERRLCRRSLSEQSDVPVRRIPSLPVSAADHFEVFRLPIPPSSNFEPLLWRWISAHLSLRQLSFLWIRR